MLWHLCSLEKKKFYGCPIFKKLASFMKTFFILLHPFGTMMVRKSGFLRVPYMLKVNLNHYDFFHVMAPLVIRILEVILGTLSVIS
jgi:hypothetical protein